MIQLKKQILIKVILEYKHKAVFKEYIESLYNKKRKCSFNGKKSMKFCMKVLMNSHYGSTLTNQQNFRNIKIYTNKEELLKLTKKT